MQFRKKRLQKLYIIYYIVRLFPTHIVHVLLVVGIVLNSTYHHHTHAHTHPHSSLQRFTDNAHNWSFSNSIIEEIWLFLIVFIISLCMHAVVMSYYYISHKISRPSNMAKPVSITTLTRRRQLQLCHTTIIICIACILYSIYFFFIDIKNECRI